MKKIIILIIILIFPLILISCNNEKNPVKNIKPTLFPAEECQAASSDGDWVAVWCDEFNGDQIDQSKWNVLDTPWGGGNNEDQYYHPDNVTVKDGLLEIEAKHQSYGGKQYTSGRLDTKYKGDWLYGKVEVRAKIPGGRGTWSAIWMLPTENSYGTWPRSGEIDIMEYVGYDINNIVGTFHTEKFNHNRGTQIGNSVNMATAEDEFLVYSMIWEPGKIELFVEEEFIISLSYVPGFNQDVPYHQAWPFDKAFHLILNLAIGGNWGGAMGIDNDIFPVSMFVDYVRVYQLDYPYLDKEIPEKINEIKLGKILDNMIYWDVPDDDQAINLYEIYIDGHLADVTSVNSYIMRDHEVGQYYDIKVVAVDFAGNKSESDTYPIVFQ